jgi:hypothetical protein
MTQAPLQSGSAPGFGPAFCAEVTVAARHRMATALAVMTRMAVLVVRVLPIRLHRASDAGGGRVRINSVEILE